MKITMPLKELKDAIEKSSAGALTKDAQDDERKKIKPTDSCIKISTKKDNVIFESSSKNISVLHSLPKDKSMVVEREGVCCVEAKSYIKMLKTLPKDCSVQLTYEVNKNNGKDDYTGAIQSNGILTTIAIENKSEKAKGKNDTYPVNGFTQVDYDHNKVLFSIQARTLKASVDQVLFASDPRDFSDTFQNLAIVVSDNKIYFSGTDGKRCAIYSVVADEKDCAIMLDDQKILIDGKMLKMSCKSFDNDELIEIIDCEDQEHIILAGNKTRGKLRIASNEIKQTFPNVLNVLNYACPKTITVDKADLVETIEFLSRYNPDKSIFYVKAGKSQINIEAADRGSDPDNAIVACKPIKTSLNNPVAMSNKFIIDGCKKFSGNKVKISFTEDGKKIRMESRKNPGFAYIMQSMTLG